MSGLIIYKTLRVKPMNLKTLTILIFTGLLLQSCHYQTPKDNTNTPNIILIMTDDVGLEHWGCYSGTIPTPNIDKVAKQGMVFTNAYSPSSACTPSRYSTMTGQFPGRCSHEEFTSENIDNQPYTITWNTPINENNQTLHKVLNKGGYYTGFVGKFHLGELEFDKHKNKLFPIIPENINPDTQECDSLLNIYQHLVANEVKRLTGANFVASALWENSEELPVKAIRKHNLEWITQGGIEFLESIPKDKPFFLNLNTTTLHGPNIYEDLKSGAHFSPQGRLNNPYKYQPSRKSIFNRLDSLGIKHGTAEKDYINHYNAGIIYMDDQIGAIMQKLDDLKLTDNTIVIITADHNIEPAKSTVYNKGVHVPFIVRWPKNIKANSSCDENISFVDFIPTFAEIADVKLDSNIQIDGFSFAPVFNGNKLKKRDFLYFEEGYTRAVSDGNFKYIAMRFPKDIINKLKSGEQKLITHMGKGKFAHSYIAQEYYPGYFDADQLYDLKNDPYEQNNLAYDTTYTKQLTYLKAGLQKYLDSFNYPFDLNDTLYFNLPEYKTASLKVKQLGANSIPWWNRNLVYPPKNTTFVR